MEAGHEPRFIRLADAPDAVELDTTDVVARLEAQAAENGRLEARAESFERVARAERDARRRLADRLRRERKSAEALAERAAQAEADSAAATEEVERLRHAQGFLEQQVQLLWGQLSEAERQLAWKSRPLWRKFLRRPPAGDSA
jgi:chromosome segregation ATPase